MVDDQAAAQTGGANLDGPKVPTSNPAGPVTKVREVRSAATYDYQRILDLIFRIGDCQRTVEKQLSEGRVGGLKALGLASQIVADGLELRALLQTRNEAMQRV